jgi:hypothetical protein
MSTFEFTGLRGTNPLGFLAAVGVLRLSAEHLRLTNPRLSWNDQPYWYARLTVDDELKEAEFQQQLLDGIRSRPSADEFLQGQSRRYALNSLSEVPQLLRKILLSSSFRGALLKEFPDIESTDGFLKDGRFKPLCSLLSLAGASGLDLDAKQEFQKEFANKVGKSIEKALKPFKEFRRANDATKLKKLGDKKLKFLTTLVRRFPDLTTADAFFSDSRTQEFFVALESVEATSRPRKTTKPIGETIRGLLAEALSSPKPEARGSIEESVESDDEEESGIFLFENDEVMAGVNDHKAPLPIFRRWLDDEASMACSSGGDRFLRFLAGYGVDLAAQDGATILPSAMLMLSAQQKLFPSILGIPASADLAGIKEALTGPWRRTDPRSPLGLDPERLQSHATSAMDPSKSGQRRTALAVWLAMEALPLFPVIPVAYDAAHTASFDRPVTHARGMKFAWPLWFAPLSIYSVGNLIAQMSRMIPFPISASDSEFNGAVLQEFRERGAAAFFCCEKEQNGKYFNFLPARRVA